MVRTDPIFGLAYSNLFGACVVGVILAALVMYFFFLATNRKDH